MNYQVAIRLEQLRQCSQQEGISVVGIRTLKRFATVSSGAGQNDELMYVNCQMCKKVKQFTLRGAQPMRRSVSNRALCAGTG